MGGERLFSLGMNFIPKNDRHSQPMIFAVSGAVLMIAHQVAAKATRDALFLSNFSITELPKLMVLGAIASIVAVFVVSMLIHRFGPVRVIAAAFSLSALLFFWEWWLIQQHPALAALVVYLHVVVFGAILVSGFWSVINERFDPHTAKHSIVRIAGAATFGGILGGIIAERVTSLLDLDLMLLVLGVMHGLCVIAVAGIGADEGHAVDLKEASPFDGCRVIAKERYLQQLMLLVVLSALVAALLDYSLKSKVVDLYNSDKDQLIRFFATFYAVTGVLTFGVQTLAGQAVVKRLGLGGTIAAVPGTLMFGGFIAAAFPHLWTITLLRGTQIVLANSLFRFGLELLYTPLPPHRKRPTKTLIDVAGERLGDFCGGAVVMALLFVVPALSEFVVMLFATAFASIALLVAGLLYRGYVRQLGESLRSGVIMLEHDNLVRETFLSMEETTVGINRQVLLDKIDYLSFAPHESQPDAALIEVKPASDVSPADSLQQAIATLRSRDLDQIRSALAVDPFDLRLVPHAIDLLARVGVEHDAIVALKKVALRIAGQLVDTLIDPERPALIRRRIPLILLSANDQRAADGLLLGLNDGEFEVRYRCGQILYQIISSNPAISVDSTVLFDAVQREISENGDSWQHQDTQPDAVNESPARSLRQVFILLGLALDREVVRLSMLALMSKDANLRGTALEYLENVLPEAIRRSLWPYFRTLKPAEKTEKRREAEIVDDLLKSIDSHKIKKQRLFNSNAT